jgi:glutamyl-tRNA reductase
MDNIGHSHQGMIMTVSFMSLKVLGVDHCSAPTSVSEPLAFQGECDLSVPREPPERAQAIVDREPAACSASLQHRQHAGALLRQLGDRTEAALCRELDRFFAARPDWTDTQRATIARAMCRFRNQLLHHPRSALRAATDAADPADPHPLLDAAGRVFGVANVPPGRKVALRSPGDRRPARSSV